MLGVRPPAVAGLFYPSGPGQLRGLVDELLAEAPSQASAATAAIVPHAGLVYSGSCAASVFGRLRIPPSVIIVAPNHTGAFPSRGEASVWADGAFDTPLGPVAVDEALAAALCAGSAVAIPDATAHAKEHAIEVELPFLAALAPSSAIVPIVMNAVDWTVCRALGGELADLVRNAPGPHPPLLLASSDMTHYESAESAAIKDKLALGHVERLDGEGLLQACERTRISMCGRGPAAAVLEAARLLGASRAEVVDYRHSGMVTGDDSSVVAYAGVVIR